MESKKEGLTRRQFVKGAAAGAGGLYLNAFPLIRRALALGPPPLSPGAIPKYVTPLVVPPPMPKAGTKYWRGEAVDYYEIATRQFSQQVLPAGFGATTVWGYGSARHPGTFNYPAFTIEARVGRPVRVKWINQLVDANGNYLPHLLPVDPTLHWANPGGGVDGRDTTPHFLETPGPYTGPVPLVPHVHGAHTQQQFDGYPEAWYLPNARNIPAGYAKVGTWYDTFREMGESFTGQAWGPGFSVFQYPNDQRATTLWYHDHALGITRNNVYAGPAGFYLLRCGDSDLGEGVNTPLPYPNPKGGTVIPYEIPLAIQDRSFRADGSLLYPDSRSFFDGYTGPYVPETDVPPIWNPEFFGNTIVVNGRTWPTHTVEPRRYRLRLLNGCQSRFLILKLFIGDPATPRPVAPSLPIWQIGAEGGFLPAPVQLEHALLGPAERADTIVDFSGLPDGTIVYMINEGPDEPFGGGIGEADFPFADPTTTGQVMRFVVKQRRGVRDLSVPADQLTLPAITALPDAVRTRRVSLNEHAHVPNEAGGFDGPVAALLGTVAADGTPVPLHWFDPITEHPGVGDTEVWEIHNFTVDAHPIHVHQVMFEVLDREAFVQEDPDAPPVPIGVRRDPEPWEKGARKDTVIALPGEITRIKARFDLEGLYVWHCHILEHEDNEMMRPYGVGTLPPFPPKGSGHGMP